MTKVNRIDKQNDYYDALQSEIFGNDKVTRDDLDAISETGIFFDRDNRSGAFFLQDASSIFSGSRNDAMELMPIADALKKYDWLREKYYWKAVDPDFDEVTRQCASQKEPQGYFVRIRKGARILLPCQAAIFMASENRSQMVHNVVVLEEDSQLQMITGCVSGHSVYSGVHLSIDEQFVGKNAKLISNMVHSWGKDVEVYPRAGAVVEEGGRYESSYISFKPSKKIQNNPNTWLNGKGASAKFLSIILAFAGSMIDVGGNVYLNADGTSAELVHRGVCTGGEMYQKGLLIGNANCRAHVDCAGMLINEKNQGFIESVPGIKALDSEARLSHEASIGKIAPEQVEYLQSRGMNEQEAISFLIRGFLGASIEGLGPELDNRISEIAELAGHGESR